MGGAIEGLIITNSISTTDTECHVSIFTAFSSFVGSPEHPISVGGCYIFAMFGQSLESNR